MQVLQFDPARCIGARECERECSRTWFKEENRAKSAIQITEGPDGYTMVACTQCGECIDVCPTMAIRRDRRGIVRIDKKLCVGCLSCVGFCPYLAMFFHPDYVEPFKCISCGKCVKTCPAGALEIVDLPDAPLTETERRLQEEQQARAEA
ncbi:MAG: 4Fe-4S binding protein [Chloroflexi bacterium]|nr:4Fe-4S binding protein [Chloroflexota bacterium]MBU1752032.1 4Fe-4S binding protein [Chloroflexota bacterium]